MTQTFALIMRLSCLGSVNAPINEREQIVHDKVLGAFIR